MLRVGLTGGLGSGKSTAAHIFAAHGAHVFYADEIARSLMHPGQAVYAAIIAQFGAVVTPDGSLDRPALARIAFDQGRLPELEAIVHPATIARQSQLISDLSTREPNAVAIVESALIFQTRHAGPAGWASRFDRIILVEASEDLQIARFIARSLHGASPTDEQRATLQAEARRRLAQQAHSLQAAPHCHYRLLNDGSLDHLCTQIDALWPHLQQQAACT